MENLLIVSGIRIFYIFLLFNFLSITIWYLLNISILALISFLVLIYYEIKNMSILKFPDSNYEIDIYGFHKINFKNISLYISQFKFMIPLNDDFYIVNFGLKYIAIPNAFVGSGIENDLFALLSLLSLVEAFQYCSIWPKQEPKLKWYLIRYIEFQTEK